MQKGPCCYVGRAGDEEVVVDFKDLAIICTLETRCPFEFVFRHLSGVSRPASSIVLFKCLFFPLLICTILDMPFFCVCGNFSMSSFFLFLNLL